MERQKLTLGHSPDADDAFMFYALAHHKIDSGLFEFEHVLKDIETLNQWAMSGRLDISAISVAAYPYVPGHYAILPNGISMGDGYGPILVARQACDWASLRGKKVAVPGTRTTANLALQIMFEKQIQTLVIPFDQILQAVVEGKADAGLIIHEGQLTFAEQGLHKIADLGCWWREKEGLPLPLGIDVVHRRLGPMVMQQVSRILQASIQYALDHRTQALEYAMRFGRGLSTPQADRFVGMYVNEWTVEMGPQGRQAIAHLIAKARQWGLVPHCDVEILELEEASYDTA